MNRPTVRVYAARTWRHYPALYRVAFTMSVAGEMVRSEGWVFDEDEEEGARRLHVAVGGYRRVVDARETETVEG